MNQKKIVALILAAGESSRFGQPKQILPFRGTSLLNHIKKHLSLYFVDKTFIVLGAYRNEIMKKCHLKTSEVIEFEQWKEGMGSSLSYACSKIFMQKDYDGILITLSNIPFVEKSDYGKMMDLFKGEEDILATKATNSLGVPDIFGKRYFNELLQIKGKKGAKPLIYKYLDKVKVYNNERAAFDIDSKEDFRNMEGLKNV